MFVFSLTCLSFACFQFRGDLSATLEGHNSFVLALFALPNGRIASGGFEKTVRVWEQFLSSFACFSFTVLVSIF